MCPSRIPVHRGDIQVSLIVFLTRVCLINVWCSTFRIRISFFFQYKISGRLCLVKEFRRDIIKISIPLLRTESGEAYLRNL